MHIDRKSLKTFQAARAFEAKDYRKALAIYKELSEKLGKDLFFTNISLCLNRINLEEGCDVQVNNNVNIESDGFSVTSTEGECPEGNAKVGQLLISPDSPLCLKSTQPHWLSTDIQITKEMIIEATVQYNEIIANKSRKAVLLLEGVKADGESLGSPLGKMAKSSTLNSFFKYMPCTSGKLTEIHAFKVPSEVEELRIGVCGFSLEESETVVITQLRIRESKTKDIVGSFKPPSSVIADMSIIGWSEYPDLDKPYVLSVMDEFTTSCFSGELNLIQPRPDNWYALFEKYQPAAVFIESAWKGNQGSWQFRVADYSHRPGPELFHLCQYAKSKKIPIIFWNKEDPVHHKKFLSAANLADYVFTTDSDMICSYQEHTGNKNVFSLPFAAQPTLHKPAPLESRRARCCFAGSWYANRHVQRGESMRWLLEAAQKYGLDIYDRNFNSVSSSFPEEFHECVKGSLPYRELCDEYRAYRVFLNVNSVSNSPTMFSRRVFELMASGTPVVSTYAKGIEDLFDSGAVLLVHSQEEAVEALHTLMTDDAEWRRRSLAGIREVFAKHTYAHRLNDIFCSVGIAARVPIDPFVTLLAEAHSQTDLEALHNFSRNQSYREFRLAVACAPELVAPEVSVSDQITLLKMHQKESWLSNHHSVSSLAGWLSPRHRYGEHYLRDLINASYYAPEASGWAKSLASDHFGFGKEASMSGSLWRTSEFLSSAIKSHPDGSVIKANLFIADSDQFKVFGPISRVLEA